MNRLLTTIHHAANLIACTLREIFDENLYARFLARTGLANSPASYAAFARQEAQHRERRARCC